MKTALLVGASGLTGRCCLDLLLDDNEYEKVTILTRRPLPEAHDKLEQHVVDFDNLKASAEIGLQRSGRACNRMRRITRGSNSSFTDGLTASRP
jgi:hypothetical protein